MPFPESYKYGERKHYFCFFDLGVQNIGKKRQGRTVNDYENEVNQEEKSYEQLLTAVRLQR